MKPVACWVLRLEQSANVVEYLVVIWPGGKCEFEETPALQELLPPQVRLTPDARALFFHESLVDMRDASGHDTRDPFGHITNTLCSYTRQIKLPRSLVKQILRAKRRGFRRDHSKLAWDDPRRTHLDLLATVIDKQLEALFWQDVVKFMEIRPTHRIDQSVPQTTNPPDGSELNFPSRVDSPQRF